MILRTWCGSRVDTKEYRGLSIHFRVTLGWWRWLWFDCVLGWSEWRGSLDGRPVMYIKRLFWFPVGYSFKRGKVLSVRVDLHKMIRPDDLYCYHSHPAYAIRLVLKGGYWELYDVVDGESTSTRRWLPGQFGLVHPNFVHRIASLVRGGPSYSLWIRGPIVADVRLIGDGWKDQQGIHAERN